MTKKKKNNEVMKNKRILIGVISLVIVAVAAVIFSTLYTSGNEENMQSNLNKSSSGTMDQGVVATVNGKDIYAREVLAIQQQLASQGQNLTDEQALQQAVTITVLNQELEEEEYILTTQEAESQLTTQLEAQGSNLTQYKQQLQMQGVPYKNMIDNYKFQFAVQNYFNENIQEVNVTDAEVEQYYNLYSQQFKKDVPPLEEVREQIREQIKQEKVSELRNRLISSLVEQANVTYAN